MSSGELSSVAGLQSVLGSGNVSLRELPLRLADITAGVLGGLTPPRVSGALAASYAVVSVPGGAELVTGSPYARVIRFGWPAKNIRGRDFLAAGVAAAERDLNNLLEEGIF